LKIVSLKRKSIPKLAVLATGMAAAVMVAAVNMAPAQANPFNPGSPNCTECHTAGGSVLATTTPIAVGGAPYTVTLAFTGSTSSTAVGYRITRAGETPVFASDATTAEMTAPAAIGSYTYTVWMRSGVVATTTYTINITEAAPATTAPATTAPATTAPATTAPATVAPTVVPTVVPTTIPPVVAPAVVPVGAPATGAGGAAQSNGSPLMGFGGLALLLSGAAMVTAIRRRRQV